MFLCLSYKSLLQLLSIHSTQFLWPKESRKRRKNYFLLLLLFLWSRKSRFVIHEVDVICFASLFSPFVPFFPRRPRLNFLADYDLTNATATILLLFPAFTRMAAARRHLDFYDTAKEASFLRVKLKFSSIASHWLWLGRVFFWRRRRRWRS